MSDKVSDCCEAEMIECGRRGFFYVTPILLPRIKGNPLNLPKEEILYKCTNCGKPCQPVEEGEE